MPHNIIKQTLLLQFAALCTALVISAVPAGAVPQEQQPSEPQAQQLQEQPQGVQLQLLRDRVLRSVAHDSTLIGDGTSAAPLGVAVPLVLRGSVEATGPAAVISGINVSGSSVAGVLGSANFTGVLGSANFIGVLGSADFIGVRGVGSVGVQGESPVDVGVLGRGGLTGVLGSSTSGGNAGEFDGNVSVSGTLTKGGGSFKIDHPLDPGNKYLSHSFVESPDMMNIYNGNAVLDGNGEATVTMPEWFESLNREFRYQLTAVGAPGPNLHVAEEVRGSRFKIAGGQAGMKVSWQVTGIRQDAWANAHRIQVEENKPEKERKHYLHPELFGESEEMSVQWAKHPELMKQMKEEAVKESAAPRPKRF